MAGFHGWKVEIESLANGHKRATATKKDKGFIFTEGAASINDDILLERLHDEILAQEVRDAEPGSVEHTRLSELHAEQNLAKRIANRTRGIERAMREGASSEEALNAPVVANP